MWRETWSRDNLASIRRVYRGLLRKGRNPSKPRWDEIAQAFVVEADSEETLCEK